MSNTYDGLLQELGIPRSPGSYETYRRLKEKRAEYQARIGSQNSLEENKRLEQMLNEIGKAESHFEALAKEEKKANKWDGFDYDSLKGKKKKKKRVYIPTPIEDAAQSSEPESVLTFEERYDDIIGFMGTPDGFEAGLEQLRQLGEEGCVEAQKRLGLLYYHGEKTVAADTRESFYWYEKAALQGDAGSENQIGMMYMDGIGVEVNLEAAVKWLELAAAGKDQYAAWNLGLIYQQYLEEKDYQKAAYWYEIAANEYGTVNAYNKLGIIYIDNLGVEPDREKAIYWLEKAADAGIFAAYWNLGLVYENRFEEKDYKKAKYWYEKALESGDEEAQNKLGYVYTENGELKIIDMKKYLFWLERTVEAEDFASQMKWYEKAAMEYDDADAMFAIGRIYEDKKGDDAKAAQWYLKAIQYGNTAAQERFDRLAARTQAQNTKKKEEEKHGAAKFFARWKK